MDCSMTSFPVPHHLLKFAQVHVHWTSDAIQTSHPLTLFSFCLHSFPSSGSFPMSWLFISDGHCIGASASASVLPVSIQECSLRLTGLISLISLLSKGLSRILCSTTVQKHKFLGTQTFFMVLLSHLYMTTGKTISLTIQTFVGRVASLLFNMLSRFVIAFLLRSNHLLTMKRIKFCHLQQYSYAKWNKSDKDKCHMISLTCGI